MFAVRLLDHPAGGGGRDDPFETLERVDQLHRLCRSSLQVAGADRGVLAYLRPYYDAVFAAKLEYQPIGEKELIEVIWEATTGESRTRLRCPRSRSWRCTSRAADAT